MSIKESTQLLSKEASVTLLSDMLAQAEADKKFFRELVIKHVPIVELSAEDLERLR